MNSNSTKQRVFEILEPAGDMDRLSLLFDVAISGVILASVAGAVLRTDADLAANHATLLWVLEVASVAIFTVELILHLWTADCARVRSVRSPRLQYLLSLPGFVDLAAVLPFYLSLMASPEQAQALSILAVLRILKLIRLSPPLKILGSVLVNERRTLLAAGVVMLSLLVLSSTALFLVERGPQPEEFGSIHRSMWWGIATLTTVGYGDVTPVTPLGKILGSLVAILGVGMFALPAGILTTGFAQELRQRQFLVTWNLVASVPLFSNLAANDIARITRLLEPLVVQSGRAVVQEGDPADSMFFIVIGDLEVQVAGKRRRRLGSGDFFGEIGLLEGGQRSASVVTRARSQLLELDREHFDSLKSARPEIGKAVEKVAAARRKADA